MDRHRNPNCDAPDRMDEHALVRRLRNGDERAYEMLVRDFGPRMRSIARRFLPGAQDSADAVQDAFISAFQSIHSFHEDASLSTWLHRITANACLMILRSRDRHGAAPLDELLPHFDETGHHACPITRWNETFAHVATQESRTQVRACIDSLPEPYRSVLLLRDIEQFDTDQSAHLLGITPANVKTRLHRARQMLRVLLEKAFGSALHTI